MPFNGTFDPADPVCWLARGRTPDHAAKLAAVWQLHPDLPACAPIAERLARGRTRVAAMRPINDAIAAEAERQRQATNFAFTERRITDQAGNDRDVFILLGRDLHGYDWNGAIRYADGLYAARAGWDHRPFTTNVIERAAYEQGFRDGGGDISDIFDTARRAMIAAERLPGPIFSEPAKASRPLPGDWPKPTDTPRPTRWERRLIVIAGEELRRASPDAAAIDHFHGKLFDMLRENDGSRAATTIILTCAHGFIAASDIVQPILAAMNADRADQLAQDGAQRERLRDLVRHREYDDVLVIAEGLPLAVIDAHAGALPLCRTMERTRHTERLHATQLRLWLDRGFGAGATLAAGHIRWGKAIHGLTGHLGAFTARHAGLAPSRGHLVLVEHDGAIASGFISPTGEPLDPRIVVSNRTGLRAAIKQALREFAAAMLDPKSFVVSG